MALIGEKTEKQFNALSSSIQSTKILTINTKKRKNMPKKTRMKINGWNHVNGDILNLKTETVYYFVFCYTYFTFFHYVLLKVAASGNLKEFERLYKADPTRLSLQDSKGWTVFHHAASKAKTNIMEFIIQQGGGKDAHKITRKKSYRF